MRKRRDWMEEGAARSAAPNDDVHLAFFRRNLNGMILDE